MATLSRNMEKLLLRLLRVEQVNRSTDRNVVSVIANLRTARALEIRGLVVIRRHVLSIGRGVVNFTSLSTEGRKVATSLDIKVSA